MAIINGTAGNDVLTGTAQADTINAEAGNDTVDGGAGGDNIQGGAGDDVLRGGDDNDSIQDGHGADQIFGEGGDDILSVLLRGGGRLMADGGIGNDTIGAANGGGPNQSVTLIGGDGNDQISLDGFAVDNVIDAGIGDDVVVLGSTLAVAVTLGAGTDTLRLGTNFAPNADAVVINDYAPGADRLEIPYSRLLPGWSGANNPFSEGFLRLVQDGADSLLQIDPNGGGDQYVTRLRFKNVAISAFGAADFGYPPDGSAPAGRTITGTVGNDILTGGLGGDSISGLSGLDTINADAGNDTVDGGAGGDNIQGGAGDDVLRGGDDNDSIQDGHGADQIFGESGDDTIGITLRGGGRLLADGGIGNDNISAFNGGGPNQSVTLIGGDGNDRIQLDGFAVDNVIDAGTGDDVVVLGSTLAVAVTLGAGADTLRLGTNFAPNADAVVINDYTPGADRLDIPVSSLLSGWSGNNNPFSEGFLRLVQDGADSLLQIDANGGGNQYATRLRFKNVAVGAFGAADFGGYPPDGSAPAGRTITGTVGNDILTGGLGGDSISGLGGLDTINAEAGNDTVDGGAGSDTIQGGGGDDVLRGGDDNDSIQDGLGADQLFGEGGDDTIGITLRGGGRLLADGGVGNDTISAFNGGAAPNQSVTLIGGDGNDRIQLDGFAVDNVIDAGTGDDVVVLGSTLAVAVTLGAGADTLRLGTNFAPNADAVVINDYAPGTDRLEMPLGSLLPIWNGSSDPFAGGFVRLVQLGVDTLLQFDRNGGGDAFGTAVRFRNMKAGTLTSDSFQGFTPVIFTGGTSADEAIFGSSANDVLSGAGGNDVITGFGGNDHIDGGEGADTMMLSSAASNYSTIRVGDSFFVSGPDGFDRVAGIETVRFSDGSKAWSELVAAAQPFDGLRYIASYRDLAGALGANAAAGAAHFAAAGFAEGRDPIAFDPMRYVAGYGDLIGAIGTDAAASSRHYILHGAGEGRSATAFAPLSYIAGYTDLIGAFGTDTAGATRHYVTAGYAEGRITRFDAVGYLAGYADLIGAFGTDTAAAAQHYITSGYAEGRNTTSFDAMRYIAGYSDLIGALGTNVTAATLHYVSAGYAEGRSAARFDTLRYIASNADLIGAFGADTDRGERHYVEAGFREGRNTASFDPNRYLDAYSDLRAAFGTDTTKATLHFIQHGYAEGRDGGNAPMAAIVSQQVESSEPISDMWPAAPADDWVSLANSTRGGSMWWDSFAIA